MTEDEMVGWYHLLDGHEFEQALEVGDVIQPSHPVSFPSPPAFNESVLPVRWPQYWSFTFSISPSNEH